MRRLDRVLQGVPSRELSAGTISRVAICLAAAASILLAQTPVPGPATSVPKASTVAPESLQFEVASVRPGEPFPAPMRTDGGPGTKDPEHLSYQNLPFSTLLLRAFDYSITRDQLQGPEWAVDDGPTLGNGVPFSISAKVPAGATKEQIPIMLQNLLKDRFHLSFHRIQVQRDGLALVVAKGGSKLKESVGPPLDSEHDVPSRGAAAVPLRQDGFPGLGSRRNVGWVIDKGNQRTRFRDYEIANLAQQLSQWLNIRMVDRTGVTGKYDFTLDFTLPYDGSQAVGASPLSLVFIPLGEMAVHRREGPKQTQLDAVAVISSALEKQRGLKLESAKVTVEVIVIDHVDKTPTEN